MGTVEQQRIASLDPTLRPVIEALDVQFEWPANAFTRLQGTPRLRSRSEGVAGWMRGLTIRPGFSLVLNDTRHDAEQIYRHRCADALKFHVKLDGASIVGNDQGLKSDVRKDQLSYLVLPPHSMKVERVGGMTHERSITLICEREFLRAMFEETRGTLPEGIGDFIAGRSPRFEHRGAPLPAKLRRMAEELLDQPEGALGDLMIEAKAIELLCHAFTEVCDIPRNADGISARAQRRVGDLVAILDSEGANSQSVGELCRMLAWNETQMMESFKKVTGFTISGYRHRLRMDEALRRLRTSDASITEVAFDAGYEHSSNFATAFKRTFGVSPTEARTQYF
ncbi:helix-turn-helix transcriptional regulator [Novosphingobium aquimarinum]|jgi:AraC-like DNA-binding protein|uniref:helix-turn-helix transcriptional regulator n=1 Tax=Novosphingobium aquimarinum TaxID=2682494 RepID=UPI0012EC78FE|nr:AraC family transcriptional regulator [Novosphingobium aquimarinum]